MNKKRQDAWTSDEDVLLAKIVLRHMRAGKTQLEAFKEAAEKLARTPAACGYRWNASLRKSYTEDIAQVKEKSTVGRESVSEISVKSDDEQAIEQAISLLKSLKVANEEQADHLHEREQFIALQKENARLLKVVQDYEAAFKEIHNIWKWAKKEAES
ncbi:MAG TPA: RsfA family transcriptional regulator [Pseudogracilibacillus sp.]|nr:RsfA family transcriptional regulator [Pseudogracilibacillus sp.]